MPAGIAALDGGGELWAVGETTPGVIWLATGAGFGSEFKYGLLTTEGCGFDSGAPDSCDTPPAGDAPLSPVAAGGVELVGAGVAVEGGVTVVGYGEAGAVLKTLLGDAGPVGAEVTDGDCAEGIEVGICGGAYGETLAEVSGVVALGV